MRRRVADILNKALEDRVTILEASLRITTAERDAKDKRIAELQAELAKKNSQLQEVRSDEASQKARAEKAEAEVERLQAEKMRWIGINCDAGHPMPEGEFFVVCPEHYLKPSGDTLGGA